MTNQKTKKNPFLAKISTFSKNPEKKNIGPHVTNIYSQCQFPSTIHVAAHNRTFIMVMTWPDQPTLQYDTQSTSLAELRSVERRTKKKGSTAGVPGLLPSLQRRQTHTRRSWHINQIYFHWNDNLLSVYITDWKIYFVPSIPNTTTFRKFHIKTHILNINSHLPSTCAILMNVYCTLIFL